MPPSHSSETGMPASAAAAARPSTSRCRFGGQLGPEGVIVDQLQRRQSGRHGDRVAGQRARLVDRAVRRDARHDVGTAAESRRRHAAADDLAERREVGRDADTATARHRAPRGSPVMTSSKISRAPAFVQASRSVSRKPGTGGTMFMLPAIGSTMMQAIWSPSSANAALHRVDIVIRQRNRVLGETGRNARRAGYAERQRARAGLDQQRVRMAVVAALELDDLVATGMAARQPNGAHRGLGTGADHAHAFYGWQHARRSFPRSRVSSTQGAPKLRPFLAPCR